MSRSLTDRMRATPALHLTDQVLSSTPNFLVVVVVGRAATPREFAIFSIFIVTFFVAAGFNRAVPHAIAMTMRWDDELSQSAYFYLPALLVGLVVTGLLMATFAMVDTRWLALPFLLIPVLFQDAVRMHAFARRRPHIAILSDAVWLLVEAAGLLVFSTAIGAATVWGISGLCALLVTRPWRIRMRLQRRPVGASAVSAALEYATLTCLGYLTPILATPYITLLGVGALQGANVIRGPIFLLIQGLLVYWMSGPPILPNKCVSKALHLSGAILTVTLLCVPPLFIFRSFYGPRILGLTWPQVEPLVVPGLLTLILASFSLGPGTVIRKMGQFRTSAVVQGAVAPVFIAFPLLGASLAGTEGFLYATALAYLVSDVTWWIVLPKLAARSIADVPTEAIS